MIEAGGSGTGPDMPHPQEAASPRVNMASPIDP